MQFQEGAMMNLFWTPFIVKKIINGKALLHEPMIWLIGAVLRGSWTEQRSSRSGDVERGAERNRGGTGLG
ncbi:hypothetical protein M0R45_035463 [Rubus argutus]|uniref:Uncharacterized protein n=1 Tax=Rubus argutus TaxID=59490 RepID=A0AAW1VUC6_RUBAR